MHEATLVIAESDLIWKEQRAHLAHDAQGRTYHVKRLTRPQIQGEVLRSILARAVGLCSPRVSVMVDERLEPIGTIAPNLELWGPVDLKHPELLLAFSVKATLGDEDLFEAATMLQNLALDQRGRLWVLECVNMALTYVSGWYEGQPNILGSLFSFGLYAQFHREHAPQALGRWERAAALGLDAFDGPGLRLLGDVRLLNQSLGRLVEQMLEVFNGPPKPRATPPRALA
ncbi:MAG: hypothetical protein N2Z75_06500 [Meiothermus sp.]|nr:hypothetical protein [Meiothermus sp.]